MSTNELSGGEAMVRLLQGHGVEAIFGLCGDTSLPFYDALQRLDHGMRHVLTRDERSAAYMADAYARVSGKVGVCEGPSGGGATYIAPGLIEANESSVPILAITTDIATTSAGRYALTELDQAGLFRPLTKWNGVIDQAARLPAMVRAAFKAMTTGRPGAAHLGLPFDVQNAPVAVDEVWADPALGRYPAWPAAPDPAAVEAALDALLSAKAPIVVCGGGIVLAGGETDFASFVRRLDLPVLTSISGQGSLADADPLNAGVVGSNGGVPAMRELLAAADLVLFIGCRAGSVTTERWRVPAPGTRVLHVDLDPMVIAANYPTEVAIVADARLSLAAFNTALGAREERAGALPRFDGVARAGAAKAAKQAAYQPLADSAARPILPERLIAALGRQLPADAMVIADPGTPCPYVSAYLDIPGTGRRFISNRAHGALGYALSASLGAHIARPTAKCVAIMGDGSFGFTAGELETVLRIGAPITYIVVSNAVFGWIKAGQKAGYDERYFSVDFSRTDHAAVAAAFGLKSWRVEDPEDLDPVLAKALAADRPTLVDVITQPLHEAQAPVSEWVA